MISPKILVIDDEKNIRRTLSLVLTSEGYDVETCNSAKEGLDYFEKEGADLVVLDIKLPDFSGVEVLRRIRESNCDAKDIPIIMISGHATLAEAVDTVKQGATDFFEKPLDRHSLLIRVANCLKNYNLSKQVLHLKAQVKEGYEIIGKSEATISLLRQIEKIAPTKSRVLITGESGTGKELIARALHDLSPRAENAFIKVNCAAIPGELIESELFGYEPGAFTGARGRKHGLFEQADGGTIFLDEIGDMTLNAQAKVLRVLQSGEVSRVGGEKTINVDVRVIAATNKDLEKAIQVGIFREDLFFRLNVVPIYSPPLRNRISDVPLLLKSFIHRFCQENGYPPKTISDDAMGRLCAYNWPGNIRELKNMAERMVIMSGDSIKAEDLPRSISGSYEDDLFPLNTNEQLTLKAFREYAERKYIIKTLSECNWNISHAAQILGVERTNLHKKIKQLSISK